MKFGIAMLLLLSTTPAFGQLHGGDVELTVFNGQIMTDTRVYSADFGDTGIPNEIDEPGFDNLAGAFPIGSTIGFSIRDSLRKWNGADFNTIPVENLSVSVGTSLGPITTPATPGIVAGFNLNVAGDGSWHRHYDFMLNSPASTGVYLLQLDLDSSDVGIVPTDPFYIVFNQNGSETNHDNAIHYVETVIVPEPGSVAMLAICALMLVARRYRR